MPGVAVVLLAAACGSERRNTAAPASRPDTFLATAYCQRGITASGVRVAEGIVAADPAVLPLGSVIRVNGLGRRYNREYRVLDTGRAVRGRHIDVYMRDCREATAFGRRNAIVTVRRRAPATPSPVPAPQRY